MVDTPEQDGALNLPDGHSSRLKQCERRIWNQRHQITDLLWHNGKLKQANADLWISLANAKPDADLRRHLANWQAACAMLAIALIAIIATAVVADTRDLINPPCSRVTTAPAR